MIQMTGLALFAVFLDADDKNYVELDIPVCIYDDLVINIEKLL